MTTFDKKQEPVKKEYSLNEKELKLIADACIYTIPKIKDEYTLKKLIEIGKKLSKRTELTKDDLPFVAICLQTYNEHMTTQMKANPYTSLVPKLRAEKETLAAVVNKLGEQGKNGKIDSRGTHKKKGKRIVVLALLVIAAIATASTLINNHINNHQRAATIAARTVVDKYQLSDVEESVQNKVVLQWMQALDRLDFDAIFAEASAELPEDRRVDNLDAQVLEKITGPFFFVTQAVNSTDFAYQNDEERFPSLFEQGAVKLSTMRLYASETWKGTALFGSEYREALAKQDQGAVFCVAERIQREAGRVAYRISVVEAATKQILSWMVYESDFVSESGKSSFFASPYQNTFTYNSKKFDNTPWTMMFTNVAAASPHLVIEQGVLLSYIGASGHVKLPEGFATIADSAFSGNTELLSIELPEGVVDIGNSAFAGCTSLQSVSLPSSLQQIGDGAFQRCRALRGISLPGGLISIGREAFQYCDELQEVSLGEGIQAISNHAFCNCAKLQSVSLPSTLKEIGSYAFENCTAIESLAFPEGLEKIETCAFQSCTGLTAVVLPSTLKTMGHDAFKDCANLETVTVKGSVSISESQFAKTPKLSRLNLSPDVKLRKEVVAQFLQAGIEIQAPENETLSEILTAIAAEEQEKEAQAARELEEQAAKYYPVPAEGETLFVGEIPCQYAELVEIAILRSADGLQIREVTAIVTNLKVNFTSGNSINTVSVGKQSESWGSTAFALDAGQVDTGTLKMRNLRFEGDGGSATVDYVITVSTQDNTKHSLPLDTCEVEFRQVIR